MVYFKEKSGIHLKELSNTIKTVRIVSAATNVRTEHIRPVDHKSYHSRNLSSKCIEHAFD
jgi:hypothetical protein